MQIGLLADTHVPYRAPEISEAVLVALHGVDLIIHAGDVDEPWALDPLRRIAPVYAVRGNVHILDGSRGGETLPEALELDCSGFRIAVTHGHQAGLSLWWWRIRSAIRQLSGRWDFPAYDRVTIAALLRRFPHADVIVFGHTHRFYAEWWDDRLVVNPGAALSTSYFRVRYLSSVVRLTLEEGSAPRVKRIPVGEGE